MNYFKKFFLIDFYSELLISILLLFYKNMKLILLIISLHKSSSFNIFQKPGFQFNIDYADLCVYLIDF